MKRRSYSREFKVQAVKMIVEQGLSVSEVARDLGVSATGRRSNAMSLATRLRSVSSSC